MYECVFIQMNELWKKGRQCEGKGPGLLLPPADKGLGFFCEGFWQLLGSGTSGTTQELQQFRDIHPLRCSQTGANNPERVEVSTPPTIVEVGRGGAHESDPRPTAPSHSTSLDGYSAVCIWPGICRLPFFFFFFFITSEPPAAPPLQLCPWRCLWAGRQDVQPTRRSKSPLLESMCRCRLRPFQLQQS